MPAKRKESKEKGEHWEHKGRVVSKVDLGRLRNLAKSAEKLAKKLSSKK